MASLNLGNDYVIIESHLGHLNDTIIGNIFPGLPLETNDRA